MGVKHLQHCSCRRYFFRASRRSLPASRLLLLALKTRKMNGGSAGYSFFPHPGKLLGISSQRLLVVSLQVVSRHIKVVPRKSLLVSIKKKGFSHFVNYT